MIQKKKYIASDAIFSDPRCSTRKTNVLDHLAYQARKNLDHVILLEESVRHKEDNAVHEFSGRLRIGKKTEDDRKYVTERFISQDMIAKLDERNCSDASLLVRNNEFRMALNWLCVLYCQKKLGQNLSFA